MVTGTSCRTLGEPLLNRVLVVDDSHVIRKLVEVCLEQIHVDVSSIANGTDACEVLAIGAPDLLILDVGLPDMTGWDILDFIRDRNDLDDMAIIMLTGHADADDVDRAADMGADAYLLKPFRPAELRRVVIDTLRRASAAAH